MPFANFTCYKVGISACNHAIEMFYKLKLFQNCNVIITVRSTDYG